MAAVPLAAGPGQDDRLDVSGVEIERAQFAFGSS
jgi:hypothetical protein